LDYTCIKITLSDRLYGDILESELAEIGFDSFELDGPTLLAYIPSKDYDEETAQEVLSAYAEGISSQERTTIPHQNWNATWEANYEPVLIADTIYIRAPFHPERADVDYSILLEPNMSFGTGHHPTTHLMLEAMMGLELENKQVCDFGAGSGILAIYAGMHGAKGLAVEIDPQAAEAARQNLQHNDIDSFTVEVGDKATLKDHTFEIILANINRNAIEEALPILHEALRKGGKLLCAGFYDSDAPGLLEKLNAQGFGEAASKSRDGWTQITTTRL
jgi:ribosomal protein L11 methyltransferase